MATSASRRTRTRVQRLAGLSAVGALLLLGASAQAGAARPIATISRNTLHTATARRAFAQRALKRDRKRLGACRRRHPGHCQAALRAVRRARATLAREQRRVNHLRARFALAHRTVKRQRQAGTAPTNAATPNAANPSETFGEPFVKGVDTNLQGWGVGAVGQIASEMSSLGVNWAREDLSWSSVESQKGVFNWTGFDQTLAAARENGITILPIVGYAPSWASASDSADYAAFVKAAVERYGPGTAANLRWWELWNEPYFAYAWSGKTPEPEAYARDALAAAQAAKSVSPSVKLLIAADYQGSAQVGGSTQWQTSWIDDMFTAAPTLGKWIDGVSVHPYGDDPALPVATTGGWEDASGNWAFGRIDTIRAKFLAHGVDVPFWITEVGWSTSEVSEATQAQDYTDLAPQITARPWIRALFPYCLREFNSTPDKESQFGLLRYGTWEPKPAFYEIQAGFKTL